MKKIIVFTLGLFVLSACHNYKKDAQQLMLLRDSIQQESALKDSSIVEFLGDFNEIQANLDSIKKVEKLVSVKSATGREMSSAQKEQILSDIAMLNSLLQKNKDLTASLQKKLNNANFKIGKMESTIKELQVMVNNLQNQIREKDVEIVDLTGEIRKLNIDISSLNERIVTIETESQQKSETIESQTEALNRAYFVFGSLKELKDADIVEKSGGFLGIGKTPSIKKDFNRDYFTEIDIRNFDFLPLMVNKAKIVSVHPAGSFHISGEKTADTLFIDNRTEFWKAAKYLVIITD